MSEAYTQQKRYGKWGKVMRHHVRVEGVWYYHEYYGSNLSPEPCRKCYVYVDRKHEWIPRDDIDPPISPESTRCVRCRVHKIPQKT